MQRNFVSVNLPINYNIGWWRFNRPTTEARLQLLNVVDDKVMFGNRPAINFHVHTLREIDYQNFGQFLVDKICELLQQTTNESNRHILAGIQDGV